MKVSDTVPASTFFMTTPLLLKTNISMKPFKFNRRLKNRMNTLSKNLSTMIVPAKNRQIMPAPLVWTNAQVIPTHPMIKMLDADDESRVAAQSLSDQHQSQENLSYNYTMHNTSFTMPRVTTTLIPLSACPTEYSHTTKPVLVPSIKVLDDPNQENTLEHRSKATITTHLIGDWIIRESSQPFRREENEPPTQIERLDKHQESNLSQVSKPVNVNEWTVNDVCLFFNDVLGKDTFTSIIREHLIDGAALLLLQAEHLTDIFKMQLGPRLKLLNRIDQLKRGDFSTSSSS